MKKSKRLIAMFTIFSATCISNSRAQEDLLKGALEMRERRTEGLKSLQEMISKTGWLSKEQDRLATIQERNETRDVDPFGVSMDPTKGMELPPAEPTSPDLMPVEAGPTVAQALSNALEKINVTGVFPSRGEIIIGARSLRERSILVVSQGQTQYKVQITDIAPDAVHFRDVATGEEVMSPLNIMPVDAFEGITRRPPEDQVSRGISPMNAPVFEVNPEDFSPVSGTETSRQGTSVVTSNNDEASGRLTR